MIGGGPAGATTAGLLAQCGRRVLVLDRERFPRYHVGESLIPAFLRPTQEMGITERMDARGFERKYGGKLVWGNNQVPSNFSFVDALGQARVLGRRSTEMKWHDELRNVAVGTYFDNCERLPGDEYTNILIEGLDDGRFWAIPIDKGTVSVGCVTCSATAGDAGQPLEELFRSMRQRTTKLAKMLAGARQFSGFRTARDWSYHSNRFHGDGSARSWGASTTRRNTRSSTTASPRRSWSIRSAKTSRPRTSAAGQAAEPGTGVRDGDSFTANVFITQVEENFPVGPPPTVADCLVINAQAVGEHTVVLGRVDTVTPVLDQRPLLYGLRRYASSPGAALSSAGAAGVSGET